MKIPITIITGYLGAGKTTLLRRIADKSGKKIAILMNEFGEIAIDSKVVEGKNIEMTELAGGCVCCSLSGEFEAAIAEILEKVNPEWIVVETTGVAEPAALAHDVVENIAGVRLDSIVTVVDGDALIRFPNLGHTGREQIELADLVIVNKIDLIGKEKCEKLIFGIKGLNDRAEIVSTIDCKVPLSMLFGIERSRAEKPHNSHKVDFEYFDFIGGKMSHKMFLEFLGKLAPEIYRSKGFVLTDKGSFLMNYVAGRHTLEKFDCQKTEIVFIGKNIEKHKKEVHDALKKCILK